MSFERDSDDASFDLDREADTLPGHYAEITITGHLPDPDKTPTPTRDIHFVDFKDGRSSVGVTHGPTDPSRVWVVIESEHAYLHLSMEEGTARSLAGGVSAVLETFRDVRSLIRTR